VRTLPRLATFLLSRLTERNASALGDAAEQYQSGKSRWWFWRQMVSIVVQMVVRDIQERPILVVSVIAGAAILTLIEPLLHATIVTFDEQLFVRGISWFYVNGYGLPSIVSNHPWLITAVFYALVGWTVGRVAGSKQAAAVLTFAASVFACGVVSPLIQIRIGLTNLSYDLSFHTVPLGTILTQHFIVNGHVDFMNVFVFDVVILPLAALIGGLSVRRRDAKRREVAA